MLLSFTVGFGFQGLYFLLLARFLGPTEYGIFAGALALVTIFSSLAGLGSGGVMLMHTARDRTSYPRHISTALIYTAASAVPLGALAAAIGFSSDPALGGVVAILAISELVFSRYLDLGFQSFQAHEMLKGTALFNMAAGLIRLVALAAVHLGWGVHLRAIEWAIIYAIINVSLALTILAVCVKIFGRPKFCARTVKSVWRVGIFFALGMASRSIYVDSDKFFLARYEAGEATTGVYAAGSRFASFAFVPIQAIVYASNTRFFRVGAHGYLKLWREIRLLSAMVALYGAVAAVALYFLSDAVSLLLGEEYEDTAAVLQYLCVLPLLQGINYFFGDALMGVGKQAIRSVAQAFVAALAVIANVVLIPRYGWQGAALASIGSAALLAALVTALFLFGVYMEHRSGNARSRRPTVSAPKL